MIEPHQIKSKVEEEEQTEQEYSTVKRGLLSFKIQHPSAGSSLFEWVD